jgi:GNAT superfamily N-acetyltransferase
VLDLASHNAATFWRTLAEARGYRLTDGPGFLAVHGTDAYGLRVLTLGPDPDAELHGIVKAQTAGRVIVEDAYNTVTVEHLTARTLPVMVRPPAAVPPPTIPVQPVDTAEDLAVVERLVVEDFDLPAHQPYRRGEVLPESLTSNPKIKTFLVYRDGGPAGACLCVDSGAAIGVYWVVTSPRFRSQGIGRALMHAALTAYPDRPMTLSASRAGKPLYDSLGFSTVTDATWWWR